MKLPRTAGEKMAGSNVNRGSGQMALSAFRDPLGEEGLTTVR